MLYCNIWEKFDEENNLAREYKYWKLLVRSENTTLGNCVAMTKRHIEEFSEVIQEETKAFCFACQRY